MRLERDVASDQDSVDSAQFVNLRSEMVTDAGANRMVRVCVGVKAIRLPEVNVGDVEEEHPLFFCFNRCRRAAVSSIKFG
jgi:hypothetical protein